jgi:hypothetical protein
MRKLIIGSVLCLTSTLCSAATLVMSNTPAGLHQGSFSINSNYSMGGDSGDYSATGSVDNPGMSGLVGSLAYINNLISEELIPNSKDNPIFNLAIQLLCKNNTTVSYYFKANQLIVPGNIVLTPPVGCGE